MSPAQNKYYWNLWKGVCDANGFVVSKGRLSWDESRITELGRQMLVYAEQLARAEHRGLGIDDVRHGAHIVALGRDVSMKDLTTKEFSRVKCCFELLIDPDNLAAQMEWADPTIAEKRSLVAFIKRCAPEPYICAITKRKYDTIFWEDLEIANLRVLCRAVRNCRGGNVSWPRGKARHAKPATPQPIPAGEPSDNDGDNVPF